MKIKTAIISSVIALAMIGIAGYFLASHTQKESTVAVFEQPEFVFEIADTDAKRVQGLSGRRDVPADYGLLFVFPASDVYGFWMKDMYVSIDIAWLAEDGTVLGIEENVSPDTFPEAFYPPQSVRLVLETKAGEMHRQGWEIGEKVPLPQL